MKFTEFLSGNLDRRRGFQTELADHLEVAKSTISAWRQGATPDFASCLKLADFFQLDPLELFEMLDDPQYVSVYMRFFVAPLREAESAAPEAADEAPRGRVAGPGEQSLYRDPSHARLHKDLQSLLTAGTAEAQAIATMIRMAARQLRAAPGVQGLPPKRERNPDSSGGRSPERNQESPGDTARESLARGGITRRRAG